MPLPEDFIEAEHLQDVVLSLQNKIVRSEFTDIEPENWGKDVNSSRGALQIACTHKEADSLSMTLIRLWLFYGLMRKCKDFHPSIFGEPITSYQETLKYYPQIQIHFEERYEETEKGYDPLRTRISFRLMKETPTTLSKSDLVTLANKIKLLFFDPTVFSFRRGKTLISYIDGSKGYHLQLLVKDLAEGKKVIEKVLDINSHVPDWKLLNYKNNAEATKAYPTIPSLARILDKNYRQPRRRPVGTVHARHVLLHLHGRPAPIVLVDPHRKYSSAILR